MPCPSLNNYHDPTRRIRRGAWRQDLEPRVAKSLNGGIDAARHAILSPRTERSSGTERTDRGEKFDDYAKAGVREYWYWMLDLEARTVEVYVLRAHVYHLLGKWSAGESARPGVLAGFTMALSGVLEPPR